MSKNVNKNQLGILLDALEKEPNIAQGFVKCDKQKHDNFWKEVTLALNTAGPPSKNESDWNKVWCDQKKYVRKKSQQNLAALKKTGGGPYQPKEITPLEQRIFDLTSMQTAVEGIEGARSFGAEEDLIQIILDSPPSTPTVDLTKGKAKASGVLTPTTAAKQPKKYAKNANTVDKNNTNALLHEEMRTLKLMLESLKCLEKIGQERNHIEKQKMLIARSALQEQKRHNREIEQIARRS